MFRLLRSKENFDSAKIPEMPFVMVLSDESIVESDSVSGLVSAVIGGDYVNIDEEQKCLMRIKLARRESMYAIQYGITAIVTDGKTTIKNNYAVDPDDEDYIYDDEELENAVQIRVDDEKLFLLSLIKLGVIRVLERIDSNVFNNTPVKNAEKTEHDNEYVEVGVEF